MISGDEYRDSITDWDASESSGTRKPALLMVFAICVARPPETEYRPRRSPVRGGSKISALEVVGTTRDDVVDVGGDAIRINSIQFIVEDASAARVQARENAVLDALAKADQFATLTGVTRGNLLFITESNGSVPQARSFVGMEAAAFADSAVTPISAGELELQISVQVVFAIGN